MVRLKLAGKIPFGPLADIINRITEEWTCLIYLFQCAEASQVRCYFLLVSHKNPCKFN